jgi:voltage-gated potassium channel
MPAASPFSDSPAGRRRSTRRLRTGLISVLVVIAGGTIGYVGFGYGILDALFQTVITVTTVGFGEVRQFSAGAKVFTIVLIFAGVGTAGYTFTVLVETLVEGHLADSFGRRRMDQRTRR